MMDAVHGALKSLYFGDEPEELSLLQRSLRGLLIPFVPIYQSARFLDQLRRVARRRELGRPVVSVGNISIGGTGKTAFVKWLCDEMIDRGYRPAILKRGEGSRDGVVGGNGSDSVTASYGDEVALLNEALPEVPIGVGADRYRQGKQIEDNHEVDLYVLDDGFQHRQLVRTMDVVLLGSPAEVNQWQLPAGPLREPVEALDRSDVISMNGSPGDSLNGWEQLLEERIGAREDRVLTVHRYRFQGIFVDGEEVTDQFRSRTGGVDLLTTLARPDKLVRFLENHGMSVDNHVQLPDHGEIDSSIVADRLNPEKTMVTDKEWVKLPPKVRGTVGRIRSSLEVEDDDRILREVEALMDGDNE